MTRHKDKVVIVTGGGGSIGSSISDAFGIEGATVAVCDIDLAAASVVAERIRASGGSASAFECDVTDAAAVDKVVGEIVATFGRIDVLVNNAGAIRDSRLEGMTEGQWDLVVDLTLKGSFLLCRACMPALKAARGRIVNIGSMSYRGNFGQANYASAKAGLVGLTKALGLEFARHGVTVNLVAPGLVEGPSLDALGPEVAARLAKTIPIGRPATGAEIAHAVMFFADTAAASVTRQVLHVSGGHEGF